MAKDCFKTIPNMTLMLDSMTLTLCILDALTKANLYKKFEFDPTEVPIDTNL